MQKGWAWGVEPRVGSVAAGARRRLRPGNAAEPCQGSPVTILELARAALSCISPVSVCLVTGLRWRQGLGDRALRGSSRGGLCPHVAFPSAPPLAGRTRSLLASKRLIPCSEDWCMERKPAWSANLRSPPCTARHGTARQRSGVRVARRGVARQGGWGKNTFPPPTGTSCACPHPLRPRHIMAEPSAPNPPPTPVQASSGEVLVPESWAERSKVNAQHTQAVFAAHAASELGTRFHTPLGCWPTTRWSRWARRDHRGSGAAAHTTPIPPNRCHVENGAGA